MPRTGEDVILLAARAARGPAGFRGSVERLLSLMGAPMGGESDSPALSPWFWELLESSNANLRALCRRLEQLPKEQLRAYQRQYDEAKEFVNPIYRDELFRYITGNCSEDHGDDFSAWVVMQGRRFYERVRADAPSIQRYLDLFNEAECRSGVSPGWDESVDREEYRGYQRADCIARPIYRLRFGREIDEEPA